MIKDACDAWQEQAGPCGTAIYLKMGARVSGEDRIWQWQARRLPLGRVSVRMAE